MKGITYKVLWIAPVYLLVLICMCMAVKLIPDAYFRYEKKDVSLSSDEGNDSVNGSWSFEWSGDISIKIPEHVMELVVVNKEAADGIIEVITADANLEISSPMPLDLSGLIEPVSVSFNNGVLSIDDQPKIQNIKLGIFQPIRINNENQSSVSGYGYTYGVATVRLPKGATLLNPEVMENGL